MFEKTHKWCDVREKPLALNGKCEFNQHYAKHFRIILRPISKKNFMIKTLKKVPTTTSMLPLYLKTMSTRETLVIRDFKKVLLYHV